MVVRTKSWRPGTTGLHIGHGNVQRNFPPHVLRVELELDHLLIECTLDPEFWNGDPVIHDERLILWLEAKRVTGKLATPPAPVAMIPAGDHTFRLQPIDHNEERKTRYLVGFTG